MFKDFEERFGPKTINDIVFSSNQTRVLLEDLITGDRPFPIAEGKCGILLYGVPGTGKSSLAKLLPDAIEQARGGDSADEMYVKVQSGGNGVAMLSKISNVSMLMPLGTYRYFVLDEVDQLKIDAMKILKSSMNNKGCVWILTTNDLSLVEAGVKDRCYCIPFNAAPTKNWFPLARRILEHVGVLSVTDLQLDAIIAPCNGSARQITDAILSLALQAKRSGLPL